MSIMGSRTLSREEYPTLTTPDAPGRKGVGKVAGGFQVWS